MGNFIAFLIFSSLHIPLFIVEKNAESLNVPKIQVVGGTDIEHPILRIYNENPKSITEIQYLLLSADHPFMTKRTETDIEVVPGVAPCRVRVRATVGHSVSKWSKPTVINLIEKDSRLNLVVKDGY